MSIAFDPTFPDVVERRNTAYLNYGVVVTKYTGARGKALPAMPQPNLWAGSVLYWIRPVVWQTGELGKVDFGGGGTVAKYIAGLFGRCRGCSAPVPLHACALELWQKMMYIIPTGPSMNFKSISLDGKNRRPASAHRRRPPISKVGLEWERESDVISVLFFMAVGMFVGAVSS